MNLDPPEEQLQFYINEHQKALLAYATRLVGNIQDAEDLVQETFIRLFKELFPHRKARTKRKSSRRKQQRLRRHAVRPWCFTVCRNLCLNFVNRHQRRNVLTAMENLPSNHTPDRPPDEMILRQETLALVATLSMQEQEVLQLSLGDGMSGRQIARVLALSHARVRSLLAAGLLKLRKRLAQAA